MIENEERYDQPYPRVVPLGVIIRSAVLWLWARVRGLVSVLALVSWVSSAQAIESICPGGASPRADVIVCMDAETACASETSDLCWTSNGFTTRDDHRLTDLTVVTDATKAVVGSRYFKLEGVPGETGTGFATYDVSPDSLELRVRHYLKFENYQHYYHNHFTSIQLAGDAACTRGATLEIGGYSSAYLYSAGACGVAPGSEQYHPNQGVAPAFKNGKWYLIEEAVKVDTSCTDDTLADGCNGVYKLWVDGVLVISYTNINWGGVADNAKIADVKIANYNHKRNGPLQQRALVDQIVISNDADTEIGAAVGATNIGTEVAESYATECGIDPFYIDSGINYSPESDWYYVAGGAITVCGDAGSTWRGVAATGNTSIYRTGGVTDTNTTSDFGFLRPIAEQSLRVQCTGADCGAGWFVPRGGGPVTGSEGDGNTNAYRGGAYPQWAIHGYIYLPSASVPDNKIAYLGFTGDGTTDYSNYVALSENTGKWAIIQRHADGTPGIVSTSSVTITRDVWHRFELMIWDTEGVSLMIDDVRVFNQLALTNSPTWLFDASHTADGSGTALAIIDYLGTGTVTAYYDDISVGSTSFWSADGWGSDSPFAASSGGSSILNWLRFRLRHWRMRN